MRQQVRVMLTGTRLQAVHQHIKLQRAHRGETAGASVADRIEDLLGPSWSWSGPLKRVANLRQRGGECSGGKRDLRNTAHRCSIAWRRGPLIRPDIPDRPHRATRALSDSFSVRVSRIFLPAPRASPPYRAQTPRADAHKGETVAMAAVHVT